MREIANTDRLYVVFYPKGVVRVIIAMVPLFNGENQIDMSVLLKIMLRCTIQM